MVMRAPTRPSCSSAPDIRAHCCPGSKMYGMPIVRHSSAYWSIAPGSLGAMIARPQSRTVRNESCPASAIAPVTTVFMFKRPTDSKGSSSFHVFPDDRREVPLRLFRHIFRSGDDGGGQGVLAPAGARARKSSDRVRNRLLRHLRVLGQVG